MKNSLLLLSVSLIFSCTNPHKNHKNTASNYQIIPQPVSLEMLNGRFEINANTQVSAASNLENEGLILVLVNLQ